jgi:hypothetical protein
VKPTALSRLVPCLLTGRDGTEMLLLAQSGTPSCAIPVDSTTPQRVKSAWAFALRCSAPLPPDKCMVASTGQSDGDNRDTTSLNRCTGGWKRDGVSPVPFIMEEMPGWMISQVSESHQKCAGVDTERVSVRVGPTGAKRPPTASSASCASSVR